jgi:hypothetical protein
MKKERISKGGSLFLGGFFIMMIVLYFADLDVYRFSFGHILQT